MASDGRRSEPQSGRIIAVEGQGGVTPQAVERSNVQLTIPGANIIRTARQFWTKRSESHWTVSDHNYNHKSKDRPKGKAQPLGNCGDDIIRLAPSTRSLMDSTNQ